MAAVTAHNLDMTSKPFAYLALKLDEDDHPVSLATGGLKFAKQTLKKWAQGQEAPQFEDNVEERNEPPQDSKEDALIRALNRAIEFGLSQDHLIVVTAATPGVFHMVNVLVKIVKPATKDKTPIEVTKTGAIYDLSFEEYTEIDKARHDLADLKKGLNALPAATLMSIVATFDAMILEVLGDLLKIDETWLHKSDKTIPVGRLAGGGTLEDIRNSFLDDELYTFSRGSHDEQVKYLEKVFGFAIQKDWKRWPDYIEIFERRNLVAHGETCFNQRYVRICTEHGHKGSEKLLGEVVELRTKYLRQAVDVLIEFGLLLPFVLWRKALKSQGEEEDRVFSRLNDVIYRLIQRGKYVAAERVAEFALHLKGNGAAAGTRQMLWVNRASAIRHLGDKERATQILDEVDWSASSDLFKISVASIKGDVETVCELLPSLGKAGTLNEVTFREWPVFKFVHEEEKVRQVFKQAFGKDFAISGKQTDAQVDSSSSADRDEKESSQLTGTPAAESPGTVH